MQTIHLAVEYFGQQFEWSHVGLIGLLIVLEGVLSVDNALVLGLLAKRLPKHQQQRALTYGLIGAFVFRFVAISVAGFLLQWKVVKLLGGGYLVYVALKHFLFEQQETQDDKLVTDAEGQPTLVSAETGLPLSKAAELIEIEERVPVGLPESVARDDSANPYAPPPLSGGQTAESAASWRKFWMTVLVIELTDIAFAVDSILAAMAMIPARPASLPAAAPHPQLWVVITGGILGVVLMRFAAVLFIKLLERFPRFETAAYLLVIVIGGKLLLDWWFNVGDVHVLDFHAPMLGDGATRRLNPAFWGFWLMMAASFCVGFIGKRPAARESAPPT